MTKRLSSRDCSVELGRQDCMLGGSGARPGESDARDSSRLPRPRKQFQQRLSKSNRGNPLKCLSRPSRLRTEHGMIVVMKPGATQEQIKHVIERVEQLGL